MSPRAVQPPADLAGAFGFAADTDPGLDRYLDAAARCFLRYGVRRTSVPDIAEELGVSRSTVYRRVGSIDDLGRKLLAREAGRLVAALGPVEPRGPEGVIRMLAAAVSFAAGHRVFRKLLRDEPELVGRIVVANQRRLLAAGVPFMAGALRRAMRAGRIARRDPEALAEGLLRLTISMVLAPPREEPERVLRAVLWPALRPSERDAEA